MNILLTKTDPEYREVSMKWVELNQDEYQDLLCKKLIFNNVYVNEDDNVVEQGIEIINPENSYIWDNFVVGIKYGTIYSLLLKIKFTLFILFEESLMDKYSVYPSDLQEKTIKAFKDFLYSFYTGNMTDEKGLFNELEKELSEIPSIKYKNMLYSFRNFNRVIWENKENPYNQYYYMAMVGNALHKHTDTLLTFPMNMEIVFRNKPHSCIDIDERLWFRFYNVFRKYWFDKLLSTIEEINNEESIFQTTIEDNKQYQIFQDILQKITYKPLEYRFVNNIKDLFRNMETAFDNILSDKNYCIEELNDSLSEAYDKEEELTKEIEELKNELKINGEENDL